VMDNRVRSTKRRAMFIQTLRNDPTKQRKDNRGRGRTVRPQFGKGNITANVSTIPVITSSALTPLKVPPTPRVSTTVVRTPKRPTYLARSSSHNPVVNSVNNMEYTTGYLNARKTEIYVTPQSRALMLDMS
jgi:hypothetical protein